MERKPVIGLIMISGASWCVFQNFWCRSDVKRQMHLADYISARSPFDKLEDTRPAPTALVSTNHPSMQRYVDALQ